MQNRSSRTAFLVLLFLLVIAFGLIIRPFFAPALIALLIAVICQPINRLCQRVLRERRYLSASLATIIVALCILVPMGIIISIAAVNAVSAVQALTDKLQVGAIAQSIDQLSLWLQQHLQSIAGIDTPRLDLREQLISWLSSAGSLAYDYFPRIFSATTNIFAGGILIVIFLFIFFAEGPGLFRAIMEILPLQEHHKKIMTDELTSVITGTFTAMIATAIAQATMIGIGFWIAGISNALVWGVLAVGITLIPIIGGPIMYVPPAVALLLNGHIGSGIFLLLWGVGIISTIDNVVKPIAMRGKVKVHPVLLALAIIGGTLWLGLLGLIIGPMVVALMLAMLRIYRQEFLEEPRQKA